MNSESREVKKRKSFEALHAAPGHGDVERQSRPLVPLVTAQKRYTKQQAGTEGWESFKVREGTSILRPIPRHAQQSWSADKTIRGQHSAPDGSAGDAKRTELRGSKSAPDLRTPVLAAIQAIKDGTIQVDERTRAKIAQAARRVLNAREAFQRGGQDTEQATGSEIAILRTVPNSAGRRRTSQRSLHQQAEVPSLGATLRHNQPQDYDLQKAQSEASPTARLSLQHLTAEPISHDLSVAPRAKSFPFTVTSGLPRFPHEVCSEDSNLLPQLTSRPLRTTSVLPKVAQDRKRQSDIVKEENDHNCK